VAEVIQSDAGTQPEHAERFYLPELDVLRFFAFFAVFVWHLPPSGIWFFWGCGAVGYLGIAGIFGVDLFFTLSGYLLTRLLIREREQIGDINPKAFYVRRSLRIWPLYYFYVGFIFLLSWLPVSLTSAPPLIIDPFARMELGTYFFVATFLFNFNFANHVSPGHIPYIFNLWTISVEEQFYLFWPWLVRYLPRRRIVVIPIVMLVVACVARAISLPLKVDTDVWNNSFTRLDPIAVGILIALMPRLNPRRAGRVALVLFGIAAWVFAADYGELPLQVSTLKISLAYPAVALGSGAFLLATLGTTSLNPASALGRSLVYLGKISYGLYVYGPLAKTVVLLFLFRVMFEKFVAAGWPPWTPWVAFVLLAAGLNLAIAAASYRWLEAPFLRLKERFTRVPSRAV
jgi:peptidoglycan/LPS O-acetylase OafA/YrhL